MTKHKKKPGAQTDIEDLILFAENDQTFTKAMEQDFLSRQTESLVLLAIKYINSDVKPQSIIGLKELSIKLRDEEFCKNLKNL